MRQVPAGWSPRKAEDRRYSIHWASVCGRVAGAIMFVSIWSSGVRFEDAHGLAAPSISSRDILVVSQQLVIDYRQGRRIRRSQRNTPALSRMEDAGGRDSSPGWDEGVIPSCKVSIW